MSSPTSIITIEQVKELRDATGISVMQCRQALVEAEGDMKKALAILKKTSSDIALKKGDREAKDGRVSVKMGKDGDKDKAVLISLRCETDFVAKNEDFANLLETLSDQAFSKGIEEMKKEAKGMIDPVIQKTGENIQLGESYEVKGEVLGSYVHNNKIAVIVSLSGGDQETAKDIAMHIAAMKPEYIKREEISEEARQTMTEIFEKEVANINKPEEVKAKMLQGKIASYFKEKTLPDQPFIKNPEETIEELLEKKGAELKEVARHSI